MSQFAIIEFTGSHSQTIAEGDDLEELVQMAALKSGIDIERPVADGGDEDGAL